MPNELNQDVLKRLARLGALARLEQIEAERKAILAAFPGLGATRSAPKQAVRRQQAQSLPAAKARRRRSKMTAAQRKEVSDRMKRYWADRRKSAKG